MHYIMLYPTVIYTILQYYTMMAVGDSRDVDAATHDDDLYAADDEDEDDDQGYHGGDDGAKDREEE